MMFCVFFILSEQVVIFTPVLGVASVFMRVYTSCLCCLMNIKQVFYLTGKGIEECGKFTNMTS